MLEGRINHSGTLLPGGKLLVAGGTNTVPELNPDENAARGSAARRIGKGITPSRRKMLLVAAPSADLVQLPALTLARLIRERQVTAVEVMQAHLDRIAERNPTINAVVAIAADALDQAAARDRARGEDQPVGPLHGVPFTAKDIIETADLPTTLGMPEFADNRPNRDATIVRRMREAGGILIGKTNCPPGGGGGQTDNDLHGRTVNPYDLTRTPAGSSGGEAAAIASGMSACGLGSDSGGSLRMPAHFCGIATLKPTAGRIPITGVLDDEGSLGPMSDPRTQPGPMARSVNDLAAILTILAGPDGRDSGAMPVPLGDPAGIELRGLRVNLHIVDGDSAPEPDIERAVREAARALAEAGALVTESALPAGGQELTDRVWKSYGDAVSASELYRILRDWDRYRSTMLEFLETTDLILSPVAPHGALVPDAPVSWRYTAPHSLTGWPCAVVRAGSSGVLPVGVQVVAGPWQDHVALAVAARIEDALGGWQAPRWPPG
jgi:amidase